MESTKLILSEPVLPPRPLDNVPMYVGMVSLGKKIATEQPGKIDGSSDEKKKQIARDFESVLLNKLLDEMKDTIGDWGFEKDGVSTQIKGIFWLYLARDIASKGGFGLWKDIYESCLSADKFLTNAEWQPQSQLGAANQPTVESLNENI